MAHEGKWSLGMWIDSGGADRPVAMGTRRDRQVKNRIINRASDHPFAVSASAAEHFCLHVLLPRGWRCRPRLRVLWAQCVPQMCRECVLAAKLPTTCAAMQLARCARKMCCKAACKDSADRFSSAAHTHSVDNQRKKTQQKRNIETKWVEKIQCTFQQDELKKLPLRKKTPFRLFRRIPRYE